MLDRGGDRNGIVGIRPNGRVAARVVHRRVGGDDDGVPQAIASTIGIPKPSKRDG